MIFAFKLFSHPYFCAAQADVPVETAAVEVLVD
jgi:hypothetical protein